MMKKAPESEVQIFSEGSIKLPHGNITEKFLSTVANKIIEFLKLKSVTITIILVDNAFIREINKKYRNRDKSTDVISFVYSENPIPIVELENENLGDIYISVEKAEEQCAQFNNSFEDEIIRLLIHGILHVAGFNHELSDKDAEKMDEIESRILEHIISKSETED